MKLKKSKVVFDKDAHSYYLGDLQLSGITSILTKYIFQDKYASVPESVLVKAAERGRRIHEDVQMYDDIGLLSDSEEARNYAKLKMENGLVTISSEYLVSDNVYFATMVDKVFRSTDNSVNLCDIKTTYTLDKEYLSWQLSINAVLFEMQNPKIKVDNLFGIWLRGDIAKIVSIDRKPDDWVTDLLSCAANGDSWQNPAITSLTTHDSRLDRLAKIESIIMEAEMVKQSYLSEYEDLKLSLMAAMAAEGVQKWETDNIVCTFVEPTTSETFDSKRFKTENPDTYKQYVKLTDKKGYLKIKLKDDKKDY